MYNQNLFDNAIKMQIQKKRRGKNFPGLFNSLFNGQNNNWGGNGGWGENQWGQNNMGQGQFGDLEHSMMAFLGNQNLWGNNLDGYAWVQQQNKRQAFDIVQSDNKTGIFGLGDIGQFIEKQITFLQPSPAEQRLKQLEREGKKFLDDRFPPNRASLCGQYGSIAEWNSINWKPISQIMSQSQIFKGKVEPNDIKQGYLGDCYFLAGLAALAERPDRIFNLFLLKQKNMVCYYSLKMLYKGKWLTIDMDQHIPCLNGKPAFSKANQNQLWVILLQKAWAKLYSSYKRIEAGYPEQPLHDLTGAPIKQILTANLTNGAIKEQEWNYLVQASQKQYAMVASSRPGSDRNQSQSGIVQGHAYTFLNATVLNFQGGSQRVVQLRNPWGKGQNKGRWNDNDPNWGRVPPGQKQRIGFNPNMDDGTFFMTFDAFISQFRNLTVAEINDNASYVYKSISDKNIQGGYFKIQILHQGYYSLHIDKTPERNFEDKIQDLYKYPMATLQIAKVNGNQCNRLQGIQSSRRTLFKGYTLNPGVYIAYAKINFDRQFQKQFDLNLAVYAEYACHIQIAPRQLVVMFTGDYNTRWNPEQHISRQSTWNNLGNSTYRNSGNAWGNEQGGNWNGGNQGWGNQGWGGNQGNNQGWGNQGNNQGWGNQGGNQGWGNQGGNQGWGNQGGSQEWGGGNQGGNNSWGLLQGHSNSWESNNSSGQQHSWGNNSAEWENNSNNWNNPNKGPNSSWGPGW